jgi:hypothetical protein
MRDEVALDKLASYCLHAQAAVSSLPNEACGCQKFGRRR